MKEAIMISVRPERMAKILRGEIKTIVLKTAPKRGLPIDVFVYCANGSERFISTDAGISRINGKVVAKFTLRKAEEIICRPICGEWESYTETLGYSEISEASCLENREIVRYLKGKKGYAWHISDLEIFDEPKELGEFSYLVRKFHVDGFVVPLYGKVAKAPQSWQYVEVEE